MTDHLLRDLQHWFAVHCNGNREHHQGISIETTDNPGWWIKIGLKDTELADDALRRLPRTSIPTASRSARAG